MKFYQLKDDEKYRVAIALGEEHIQIGGCPKHGMKHPFIWKRREGRKGDYLIELPSLNIGDFVFTWDYEVLMITDKVAELFKEAGFSGYELRPVRIHKIKRIRNGAFIPNLWELVVTGWGGIAPEESGIKKIYECEACGYWRYSGLNNPSALIDPSQWDGSDFFIVFPLVKYRFVTEKVKEFVKDKKLKGCIFVESKDIKFLSDEISCSPRCLYSYMPKERVKEIGKQYGLYWEPPAKNTPEYKEIREALIKIYKEEFPKTTKIVYLEDEDGYLPTPMFNEGQVVKF